MRLWVCVDVKVIYVQFMGYKNEGQIIVIY